MTKTALDELYRTYELVRRQQSAGRKHFRRLRTALRRLKGLPYGIKTIQVLGTPVSTANGASLTRQCCQLTTLQMSSDFTPDEYYRFRMYCWTSGSARLFVPLAMNIAIREFLYERLGLDHRVLSDKRLFARAASSAGLPVAHTLADLAHGHVHWWANAGLPAADLFVKEAASMCGADASQ